LEGQREPCSPWEVEGDVHLRVSINGVRRARWDARLGFVKLPFLSVPLHSICPDGGVVSAVEVVVLRAGPVRYADVSGGQHANGDVASISTMDGGDTMAQFGESESAVDVPLQKHVLSSAGTTISAHALLPVGAALELAKGDLDGDRLWTLQDRTRDPEAFWTGLNDEQRISMQRQRDLFGRTSEEAGRGHHSLAGGQADESVVFRGSRNGVGNRSAGGQPFVQVRVCEPPGQDGRVGSMMRTFEAMLTVWRPAEDVLEMLKEKRRLRLHKVVVQGRRQRAHALLRMTLQRGGMIRDLGECKELLPRWEHAGKTIKDLQRPSREREDVEFTGIVVAIGSVHGSIVRAFLDGERDGHVCYHAIVCDGEGSLVRVRLHRAANEQSAWQPGGLVHVRDGVRVAWDHVLGGAIVRLFDYSEVSAVSPSASDTLRASLQWPEGWDLCDGGECLRGFARALRQRLVWMQGLSALPLSLSENPCGGIARVQEQGGSGKGGGLGQVRHVMGSVLWDSEWEVMMRDFRDREVEDRVFVFGDRWMQDVVGYDCGSSRAGWELTDGFDEGVTAPGENLAKARGKDEGRLVTCCWVSDGGTFCEALQVDELGLLAWLRTCAGCSQQGAELVRQLADGLGVGGVVGEDDADGARWDLVCGCIGAALWHMPPANGARTKLRRECGFMCSMLRWRSMDGRPGWSRVMMSEVVGRSGECCALLRQVGGVELWRRMGESTTLARHRDSLHVLGKVLSLVRTEVRCLRTGRPSLLANECFVDAIGAGQAERWRSGMLAPHASWRRGEHWRSVASACCQY
jgi:hypothetical protein